MACVQEAGRLYPPIPFLLLRRVAKGGLKINDQFIPGTDIGAAAPAINFNEGLYGHDASAWRPERWLGKGEGTRKMRRLNFTFGQGSLIREF
ncbi:MAG: hypothetical protein LQ340_006786 [Diploschistes diacapsis]|nr:MAG: hypothetical protein LQ340_006786 [Diploschistes diacapsis]